MGIQELARCQLSVYQNPYASRYGCPYTMLLSSLSLVQLLTPAAWITPLLLTEGRHAYRSAGLSFPVERSDPAGHWSQGARDTVEATLCALATATTAIPKSLE